MGFNLPQWKFLRKCFRETGLLASDSKLPQAGVLLEDEGYYGKKMLELGCQNIRDKIRSQLKSKASARSYFNSIGISTVSIDITGCNYSKIVDLRKPIDDIYHNRFDIITNSGTTEHVVPFDGQYQAFKNIHLCAKRGAVMIHILPEKRKYLGHCQTYYSQKFFKLLAKNNNYEISLMEPVKDRASSLWTGVCFVKLEDNDFSLDKSIFLDNIHFIKKSVMKDHRKHKKRHMGF